MVFVVLSRLTVPAEPDVLRNVPAEIVPAVFCVMVPDVADRSIAAVAVTTAPAFRSIVPAFSVTAAALRAFVTDKLPLLIRLKSPALTANVPTDPMAFAVPASETVPATPDVLCNTAAAITPPADCVTPPTETLLRSSLLVVTPTAFRLIPPSASSVTEPLVALVTRSAFKTIWPPDVAIVPA